MKLKTITKQYRITLMVIAMLGLGSLAYALVVPDVSEAQAETNISVGTSGYTLSVSSSTSGLVDMSVNPTAAGSFAMVKETLNTKTNADGFSMYIGMQGSTNSLYLNGDTSSTALPATNAGTASYTNPNTISTNSWGYAIPQSATMPIDGGTLINNNLASGNGFSTGSYIDNSDSETNTKWAPVPVKGNEQIVQSTSSANNTTGVDLNVFYATKVNSNQAAGIYKGTVVYTAVAKSNNALIASSSPSTTKKLDGGDTITITIGTNTSYSNLTTKNVTITNDLANATSADACTVTGGGNNQDGTLYLTCTLPAKKQSGYYDINIDLGSYGTYTIAGGIEYVYIEQTMQNIAMICPTLSTGNTTTLKDKRDSQEYTVFKAADGNCWMGENLRYGINPDNSAHPWVAADEALTASGVNATMMANLTYDSANPNTAGRIKNGDSGMKTADNSQNAFSSNGDNYTMPYINIYQANTVADYDGQTKYGVLYNYCAATGGTACTDSSTVPTVSGSICPAGWTLPSYATTSTGTPSSSDTDKSWQKFLNNYGIADFSNSLSILVASPLNFVRAGYADSGQLYSRSSSGYGYYWSASPYPSDARSAYRLRLDSRRVRQDHNDRYGGFSVRCVTS